ncbi:fasciclin domain-containing protein [uncultured Christiangramia sp.]|uniref:fasciclin domain-containing protein n=1 Tax=uncultured Christiangramia sp. TaxID=503836 RepID=UPI00261246BE|nr:fasciclin domain-containing protein [uncultured Christiangramia sp.]
MNSILKISKISILLLAICFSFTACDEDDDFMTSDDVMETPDPTDDVVESNTIADFVVANENYSSLLAALEATGLTSTFTGDDVYTFFAPDNDAFAAFLDENGFDTLEDVPTDVLTQVLLNHVQMGEIFSSDLSTGYIESMSTAGPDGENLSMYINTENGVVINGVITVETADIEVDNGVIHAVSNVIGLPNVVTFALADPTFDTLVAALTREDSYTFVSTLQASDSPAPFTVFAPTNSAFGDLLTELELEELGDVDADTLATVLSYHVLIDMNVTSDELEDGIVITSLQGADFTINLGDTATITDANGRTSTIIAADVQATNGVIHAIDTVILPTL